MIDFQRNLLNSMWHFIPIFVRVAGVMMTLPILRRKEVPIKIKISFAALFSFLLMPLVPNRLAISNNVGDIFLILIKEGSIGLVIGLISNFLFAAIRMAGDFIGFLMGLSIANVLDPESGANISVIAELYYFFAALLFLALGGHHLWLQALKQSFFILPLDQARFTGSIVKQIVDSAGIIFSMGFQFAAPVVMSLFLVSILFGILARTVPQMNILIVGFPIRIGVGFIIISITLRGVMVLFEKLLAQSITDILNIIALLKYGVG